MIPKEIQGLSITFSNVAQIEEKLGFMTLP
jgi:hypothetical protein